MAMFNVKRERERIIRLCSSQLSKALLHLLAYCFSFVATLMLWFKVQTYWIR